MYKKRNIAMGTLNIVGAVAAITIAGLLIVNSIEDLQKK